MRSLLALTIVLGSYGLAHADADKPPDKGIEDHARADLIFEEAQQLKQAGKTAEACTKYEEALSFNRNAVGTLLNVGLCAHEAGKVATAVKYFTQARDLAREHNLQEHRKAAEEHLAKNEPLVPHLAIAFSDVAPNTKLVIDDEVYPIDSAGDIRIDPGARHVVVTAPGRVPYETTVELKQQERKAIAIPKLGLPVTVKRTRRTVGKIVTISGVALMATGVVIGLKARGDYNKQVGEGPGFNCSPGVGDAPPMCNADGFKATGNAYTLGTVGTVVGVAGIAAFGLGAYLWFFAPKDAPERNVAIVPTVDSETAGFAAIGRF